MRFTTIEEELTVTKFKKAIEREIEGYFEEMEFDLIEPRIFQKYDEYVNSEHKQDSSKTVKVLSGNSRIFILRPDITINVLGEIFSKWDGEPPLKVYYNSTIYLNKEGGKILENHQMGIEY
ncbi:MAG: ATP phosphoribosyltransferase regulatory subunit, partial [Tissierellaceae bacterium]